MKKMLLVFAVAVALIGLALAGAEAAGAKKAKKGPAQSVIIAPVSAELKDEEVISKFKETFKNVKSVESVSKTPVEGIYEIVGNGGSAIFYYAPKSDTLFFGDMVNKEMKSLTHERRNAIQQAKLVEIPLDKAINIGSGQHKVIEFTDPDCPYCRQAASYFKDKNVTKYVFLRPIPALHPKAEEKCRYILDAPDKAKAYYEAMNGALDKEDLSKKTFSKEASEMLIAHTNVGNKVGINGTPAFWIDGKYVAGANLKIFDSLLQVQSKP